jgi:thiamine biosynthesis lipoprotein
MACRFEVTLSAAFAHHVPAAREALDEADRLEDALSLFRPASEVVRVNREAHRGATPAGDDLFSLLLLCARIHAATDGAFDVTATPLSRVWGFLKRDGRVPRPDEIEAARQEVGMDAVELAAEGRTVRFRRPGLELNFASIGKGYALDQMGKRLRAHGAEDALVSAGGSSVLARGGADGGWIVDVRSRLTQRPRLARLALSDCALGTSGSGEQFVDAGGRRLGHVLDPRTGWPASGLVSVSVVADDAAQADALSTAFLVGGVPLAERYCASHPRVLAFLTPDDGSEAPRIVGHHPGARRVDA